MNFLMNLYSNIKICHEINQDFYMIIPTKNFVSGIILEISNEFFIRKVRYLNLENEKILMDSSVMKREFRDSFMNKIYDYIINYNFVEK